MKKVLSVCFIIVVLSLICTADTGYKDINVWYGATVTFNGDLFTPTDSNGKTVQPFIYKGTTYMPIRAVVETLGAKIEWDAKNKVVVISEFQEDINVDNSDDIASKITVTEYKSSYLQTYFLVIKNNSDYNLCITAYVNFYNSAGKLVGSKSDTVNFVEKGFETMMDFMMDTGYSYAKYEFEIDKIDDTTPVQSILSYKASEMSDKVILSVTNNGDYVLNSVYADILFFKRNKIVGYNS
ncbi:MAG: stalk domain-containing protein, partial [Eubacteriales bacterium]